MFTLAALLWLLWPDLIAAVGWTKADESGQAGSHQLADAPVDQNLERLRQRQVAQARIIGTLQDELEEAEAQGVEGQQQARNLEKELAELRSQQQKTQSRLEDATKALERELSAQKQVQAELSTVKERLEARAEREAEEESQRKAQEREERLRLEKELEAERVRCARSFTTVLGPDEGAPAREVFDTSVRLVPVDTQTGLPLVVLVGADRGNYFEVLQAKRGTSEGDRPLEVFGRRQRSRYKKRLAAEEKWTFFLLTGYGYTRLGEPAERHVVTAEYDFLLSLPHLELAYRAR